MKRSPLVLDPCTAILLAKIDLLRPLARRVDLWMADSAFAEATARDTDDARLVQRLAEEGLLRTARDRPEAVSLRGQFRLGAGEAQTIVLARWMGAVSGTDDGRALRCLKVLGLPFVTAVGLLVSSTQRGDLEGSVALELLARLGTHGRCDARILDEASRRIRAVASGREEERR